MAANASKKQRPEEEAEEEMHLAFRGAANALSQVYTHAVAHQKASFLAGERRGHVHWTDPSRSFFQDDAEIVEFALDRQKNKTGDIWHVSVERQGSMICDRRERCCRGIRRVCHQRWGARYCAHEAASSLMVSPISGGRKVFVGMLLKSSTPFQAPSHRLATPVSSAQSSGKHVRDYHDQRRR